MALIDCPECKTKVSDKALSQDFRGLINFPVSGNGKGLDR
jgi:hypothetical protein